MTQVFKELQVCKDLQGRLDLLESLAHQVFKVLRALKAILDLLAWLDRPEILEQWGLLGLQAQLEQLARPEILVRLDLKALLDFRDRLELQVLPDLKERLDLLEQLAQRVP